MNFTNIQLPKNIREKIGFAKRDYLNLIFGKKVEGDFAFDICPKIVRKMVKEKIIHKNDKAVFDCIFNMTQNTTITHISKECNMNHRSVEKSLKILLNMGLINKEKKHLDSVGELHWANDIQKIVDIYYKKKKLLFEVNKIENVIKNEI